MGGRWGLFYLLFGLAALAGLALLAWLNFQRPPAFSDLPEGWFERASRADPATWTAPGAGVLDIETDGPIRVMIVTQPGDEVGTGPLPAGVQLQAASGAAHLAARVGGPRCPAQAQGPMLEVRAPIDLIVRTRGPVSVEIRQARLLMYSAQGCGRLKAGRVETGRLSLEGRVVGDIANIERGLDAVVRGPGRLHVGRMNGALDAETWGRGRIGIDSGFLARAFVFAKGGGEIDHHGEAGAVIAEARLMAKIRIAVARGLVSGAGDVEVGRPGAPVSGF